MRLRSDLEFMLCFSKRDVTERGCKISGPIRLKAVTTAVESVSMSGESAMLCSFAPEFTG